MVNCSNNLCHQFQRNIPFVASDDQPLEADPDIVGNGVIAAFLISTLITCAIIVFGYLSDSLPNSCYNEADKAIIASWQDSKISKIFIPDLYRLHSLLRSFVMKCLRMEIGTGSRKHLTGEIVTEPRRHLTRAERIEALSRFILSLSDQQLVTGLAILIATLANRCFISVYEFNIVVSLAWFSSTIHLTTLLVLQEYLKANPVIRNWRVLGMLSLMVLLMYGLLFRGDGRSDLNLPLQCTINAGPETTVTSIILMLYLLVNYTFYVIPLYDPINSRTTLPELLGQNAVKLSLSRECHRQQVDAETYDRLLEEVLAENKLKLRSKWISDLRSTASSTNNLKTLRLLYTISLAPLLKTLRLLCTLSLAPLLEILRLLCKFSHAPLLTGMLPNHTPRDKDPVVSFATTGYHESYLSQIPWIFFEISYGLTQLVYYRWLLAHGLKDSVNQMTFGQIMPLFLLALPVLAAAETYYGSHDPFEPSIQRGDVVNSRGNLISDPSTDSGSPILNDPHRTVSQSQNESCAKQTNETQASYSADVSKEISGQLTTLYKKPGMLSLLRIQFLYFSVLLIGAGITANFVGIYSFVFVCIFGIPWLIPHIYKVCSYMTSVRTQLQAELQKTSPGNGAPRQPDTSSSAPRSRPEWLAVSADNISDISKSPTATENPSTRLANQPNTVSTERPSSQIPRALSEGSSMASPKSASPAPSLDIVDAADADRQLEGPRHVLPEDDDYTHKLSERQDTEADLGVVPDRQIPAAKSSLAVPNRRVRAFSIHKWPRLEGFLQSARSAGRRRQTTP